MMVDLGSVRVVVTGATSGLGEAMTDALLEAGATVALASRPTPRLDEAVSRREKLGQKVLRLPMDVRDLDSVERAVVRVMEEFGGVDVVINNAGIGMRTVNPHFFDQPMPFYLVNPDGFADVVSTNLTGYFLVARSFAPYFVESGVGRFINVTMNHETMKRRGFVPYGPSRAGAESLSVIMAEDFDGTGVTVNMLLPGGATATGMIPEEVPATFSANLLSPKIMGPPAVFLASEEAKNLSGARIVATEFDGWLAEFRQSKNRR